MLNPVRRKHQHTTPIHIDHLDATGTALSLVRADLGTVGVDGQKYDEAWLQRLIFQFPQALPVQEIDPGLGPLVPVCLELPVGSGYVDNLYITGDGDLVIAECKLWRNPEARREVVAQAIDYAHSMAHWKYQDLDTAIRHGILPQGGKVTQSLHDIVQARTELDEARFVDAVSRNLRRGRLLLLLVGDGIREGAESLGEFLQVHAGFHFTLGLVEMPVYCLPAGAFVVQPRILARTLNIERGIVRIVDGQPHVEPTAVRTDAPSAARTTGLSQERIMEALGAVDPALPDAIRAFAEAAAEQGVFLESARKSLMVKWRGPDETDYALGGFSVDGSFISYSVNWMPDTIGRIDLAHQYLDEMASLVSGTVRRPASQGQWYVVRQGTTLPSVMEVLARQGEWLKLIESYTGRLREAIESRG